MRRLIGGRRRSRPPLPAEPRVPRTGLETCPSCEGPYVFPRAWETHRRGWHLLLICGQCRTERRVTVSADVAQRFGDEVERSRALLEADLERLVRDG